MPSNPKPTKAERRSAAVAQAAALKAEAERRRKRTMGLAVACSIIGVIVVGGIIFMIVQLGMSKQAGTAPAGATATLELPDGKTIDNGIDVSAAGVGVADDSKVTVSVFSDYMCTYCGLFETQNGEQLLEMARNGDIVFQYHPVAFLDRYSMNTKYSTRATNAAMTVLNEQPDLFPDFNAILFANQPDENTTGLSDDEIAEFAKQVGVSDETIAKFTDGTYKQWITNTSNDVAVKGINSTPTVFIDGILYTAGQDATVTINGESFTGNWQTDDLWNAIDAAAAARGYTIADGGADATPSTDTTPSTDASTTPDATEPSDAASPTQ